MFIKRLFDLCCAALGLLLLFPLLAMLAALIRIFLGVPVIFRQQRTGLQGRPFTLYKFRSMTDARDLAGELLPDAHRLTRFGRLLRKSSLDELPELFNVLKGDMSLVGPRPLLMRYKPFFTERERRRFSVLPGITGWAQINGRNSTSWDKRLEDDAWYVDHRSFRLDMTILYRTFFCVLTGKGLEVDATAVMRDLDEERAQRRLPS